jgi:hypothetical protein
MFQFVDLRIYFHHKSLHLEMRFFGNLFLACCCLFSLLEMQAQDFFPSQRSWEKMRIQYKRIRWSYLSDQNFEVYYYGKQEALARSTIQYLDSELTRISRVLGYSPYQKAKIFLYASPADLLESNSGISFQDPKKALEENQDKFKIEIAFQTNVADFQTNLVEELARVYVHDILFGGSIKDVLQSSLLLNVPEWFTSGIVAYVARGDSPEMNQYMYQVVAANKVRKPVLARGKEAELIGQSIWSYIAKTYGLQPIGNILNLTRIIRNDQSSIASTLRTPISRFLKEWFSFYLSESKQFEVNSNAFSGAENLISRDRMGEEQLSDFRISPDGKWMAYLLFDLGQYRVMIQNLQTKKRFSIFQTGLKDPLRPTVSQTPRVHWTSKNALSIMYAKEGKLWLNQYAPITGMSAQLLSKTDLKDWNFTDFEMHENGQRMLVRALRNGQVDLGIYDFRRNRFTPITQNPQDEMEAHWFNKQGDVIYLTDQYVDSTRKNKKTKGLSVLMHWRADDPSNPRVLLIHVGKIHSLQVKSDSLIYFLHEQPSGVELVSLDLSSGKLMQNRARSGTWTGFQWAGEKLYYHDRDLLFERIQRVSAQTILELPAYQWYPMDADSTAMTNAALLLEPKQEISDEREKAKRSRLERQLLIRTRKETAKLTGPFAYQNSFVVNGSEGNFKIDPIRGIGYALEFKMNDLMENHLIKTGAFLNANFKNSDMWAEYSYLPDKVDWVFRVDRKIYVHETDLFINKIRFNRAQVNGIYPINLTSKMTFAGMFTSNRSMDVFNLPVPENLATYAGTSLSYTLDNTVEWEENLPVGTRMIATVEHQQALMSSKSFSRLRLDFRKYLRLSNSFLLAGRISASHAFGPAARRTMLGGMDNWVFIDREPRTKENPLGGSVPAERDIFMSDFATSLRGFKMNKLSGNSHLLFNLELRVPVKHLINVESNKSNFMNSLQLVGFTDIGSAWTGKNPFSRTNGFNTNVLGGGTNPFQATVTDFRNPFLFGFGFGARANVLGYFVKVDYAYGMETNEIKSPATFVTLGHDF